MQAEPIFIQIEERQHFPTGADILLNWELIKELGLTIGRKLYFSFGLRRASARIGTHGAAKTIIIIHRSLAERLLIPYNINLHARYISHKNELQIGPLLGVLISKKTFTLDELLENYGAFCHEIFEAAAINNTFCYVTNLDQLSVDDGKAFGWLLHNGDWQQQYLPLPNVFYNRLGNRKQEVQGQDYLTLQKLKEAGVSIFNEQFLDKWDVYQQLYLSAVHRYLPETIKYTNIASLRQMMNAHPVIFVKPVHGSEGRGIIRIKREHSKYVFEQITINGHEQQVFNSLKELLKSTSTKLRKKSYLIQQGIDFVQWNGSPLDFRALLQKNYLGSWKITSLLARQGNPQTFVSNLAQGGKLEKAANVLKQLQAQHQSIPNVKAMKEAALEIASTLDAQLEGNYGELGIDLGVDRYGRIWLIEVNSKPSKRDDARHESVKGPRPSVLNLFEYVSYLSGYLRADAAASTTTSTNKATLKRKNRR